MPKEEPVEGMSEEEIEQLRKWILRMDPLLTLALMPGGDPKDPTRWPLRLLATFDAAREGRRGAERERDEARGIAVTLVEEARRIVSRAEAAEARARAAEGDADRLAGALGRLWAFVGCDIRDDAKAIGLDAKIEAALAAHSKGLEAKDSPR